MNQKLVRLSIRFGETTIEDTEYIATGKIGTVTRMRIKPSRQDALWNSAIESEDAAFAFACVCCSFGEYNVILMTY